MCKENITKYTCDRSNCQHSIETPKKKLNIFTRLPEGWNKVGRDILCPSCSKAYADWYKHFMNDNNNNHQEKL